MRIGRTFADYLGFMEEHPDFITVEMDAVIGRPSDKVIMTVQFVNVGLYVRSVTGEQDSC